MDEGSSNSEYDENARQVQSSDTACVTQTLQEWPLQPAEFEQLRVKNQASVIYVGASTIDKSSHWLAATIRITN